MKMQVCTFKRKEKSKLERGVAILNLGFGDYDVKYIIDSKGNKVPSIWSYTLHQGIGCYLDTELESFSS